MSPRFASDRIVVNGRFFRAKPTGLHRVARQLLDASIDAGLDVDIVKPPSLEDSVAGIGSRLTRRLGDQAWEQTTLPMLARGRRVLSLTNTAPLAAGRSIVMVHDLAPLVGPQWFTPAMQGYGRLVLTAARRAEQVLTVSEQIAGELRSRGVRAPITVIRQAVSDVSAASPLGVADVLRRFGLDEPYVLMIGWADPRKDVVTAIAAHRRALRFRRHRLVLVGLAHPVFSEVDLPDLDSLQSLGFVSDADLAALLTGARALLYPTRYEGFGRPALEAWRCGTPAIVSDLPSIREATQGRATYLPAGDVSAWASAIVAALDGEIPAPSPDPWTWADAAQQLIGALRPLTGRADRAP